jgi:hypothetical protein
MPAKIEVQRNDIYAIRLTGTLKASEFADAQAVVGGAITNGIKPRILAILDGFQGWERGADWNDLDFMFNQGAVIDKIAIVGEPEWEARLLAFAGAGFRVAPVKFFQPDQLDQARSWLTE